MSVAVTTSAMSWRSRGRRALTMAFLALACCAQSPPVEDGPSLFAPPDTRTLRSFGARGDGQQDDTLAVQRALDRSDQHCLDGQGATYRIVGSLRAARNLCLRNATLRQDLPAFDSAPFITRRCPATQDVEAVLDCGDAPLPDAQAARLGAAISVRTLLIRPEDERRKLRVFLDRVTVDRGNRPEGGSRTDSAGIWLDLAERVDLRDVEIRGAGKGFGLHVTRSSNVTLDRLFVHDLVWAPYPGDTPLREPEVAATGWNAVPIREYRNWGQQAGRPHFYGVRVQEQLTCVGLIDVTRVRIHQMRIQRCLARFQSRDLPWQTDGISIGGSSRDIRITASSVDSAWEGIDVVGGGSGIDGLVIDDFTVSNSFGFGVKLGYRLRNSRLSRLSIRNSGLAGIVLYGAVQSAVISDATVTDLGVVDVRGVPFFPWTAATRAGVRIDEAPHGVPTDILLRNIAIDHRRAGSDYHFGLLNNGGRSVRAEGLRATGYSMSLEHGTPATRP